jgi:hypothetical protein
LVPAAMSILIRKGLVVKHHRVLPNWDATPRYRLTGEGRAHRGTLTVL